MVPVKIPRKSDFHPTENPDGLKNKSTGVPPDELFEAAADLTIRCHSLGQIPKEAKRFLSRCVRAVQMDAGYLNLQLSAGRSVRSFELHHNLGGFSLPDSEPWEWIFGSPRTDPPQAVLGRVNRKIETDHGYSFGIGVPVMEDNCSFGFFLLLGNPPTGGLGDPEILNPLEIAGKVLGSVIGKLCRMENDRWVIQNLEALNSIGQLVVSKRTLKEMTLEIVRQLGTLFETDEINVILYDAKTRELSFLASYFSDPEHGRGQPERYPLSDGINSYIVRNKKPLLMRRDTVEECRRLNIRHGGKPAKSWLGVPMIMKGKVLGVLSIQSYTEEGLYDERSIRLLSTVASLCAAAVENAKLFEELLDREREKEKLYYSLTHDMLALVNPISGFSRILLNSPPGGPGQDNLRRIAENIQTATRKITKFTEDILAYGKLKSGRLILHRENVDLSRLIGQALSHSSPELMFRGLRVTVNRSPVDLVRPRLPAGPAAFCDADQVERVLINCVENGVRHARTALDLRLQERGGWVTCRIADDGDGMESGLADRVFEEYFQDPEEKRGVGLGLPTVKRIIDLHGGEIWVKTERGKGFEIGFTLPEAKPKGKPHGT